MSQKIADTKYYTRHGISFYLTKECSALKNKWPPKDNDQKMNKYDSNYLLKIPYIKHKDLNFSGTINDENINF